MGMFAAAYLVVWLGTLLYVMWLGAEQRRLQRTLESLQLQIEQPEHEKPECPPATAA